MRENGCRYWESWWYANYWKWANYCATVSATPMGIREWGCKDGGYMEIQLKSERVKLETFMECLFDFLFY